MKKHTQFNEFTENSRTFTFHQLSKISDDNYGELNSNIDMSRFKPDDVFVLNPLMIHQHAFGEPVMPHLRTVVTLLNESERLALQDLFRDQWLTGSIYQNASSLSEDSDLPF